MTWRLAAPWWEGTLKAKAKVKTQATLKVEAKVQDNDLATNNFLVEGRAKAKARGEDKCKAASRSKGIGQ